MVRINPDGTLDSLFGTNGVVNAGIAGVNDVASEVEINAAGLLVVGISTSGNDVVLKAFCLRWYFGRDERHRP